MNTWWLRLKAGVRHAFAVDTDEPLNDADVAMLRQLARKVVERRMQAPMTLLLESCRPLNYIGAQAARVLRPIAAQVFTPADYDRFCALVERRKSLDLLCELIARESSTLTEK